MSSVATMAARAPASRLQLLQVLLPGHFASCCSAIRRCTQVTKISPVSSPTGDSQFNENDNTSMNSSPRTSEPSSAWQAGILPSISYQEHHKHCMWANQTKPSSMLQHTKRTGFHLPYLTSSDCTSTLCGVPCSTSTMLAYSSQASLQQAAQTHVPLQPHSHTPDAHSSSELCFQGVQTKPSKPSNNVCHQHLYPVVPTCAPNKLADCTMQLGLGVVGKQAALQEANQLRLCTALQTKQPRSLPQAMPRLLSYTAGKSGLLQPNGQLAHCLRAYHKSGDSNRLPLTLQPVRCLSTQSAGVTDSIVPHGEPGKEAFPQTILVKAYYIGSRIDLPRMLQQFPGNKVVGQDSCILTTPADHTSEQLSTSPNASDGMAVVHKYGSVVLFGPPATVDNGAGLWQFVLPFTQGVLKNSHQEGYTFVVNPHARHWVAKGKDCMILQEMDEGNSAVIAAVLGRSAALRHYQLQVDAMLGELYARQQAALRGATADGGNQVLLLARAHLMRLEVMQQLVLLDPASSAAWNSDRYHMTWEKLCKEFELHTRVRALELKLQEVQRQGSHNVEHWQARQMNFLVSAVIAVLCCSVAVHAVTRHALFG